MTVKKKKPGKGWQRVRKDSYVKESAPPDMRRHKPRELGHRKEYYPLLVLRGTKTKVAPEVRAVVAHEGPTGALSDRMYLERIPKRMQTLQQALRNKKEFKGIVENRFKILDDLARIMVEQVRVGVVHGNLKLDHIFYDKKALQGERKQSTMFIDYELGRLADAEQRLYPARYYSHPADYETVSSFIDHVVSRARDAGIKLEPNEKGIMQKYLQVRYDKHVSDLHPAKKPVKTLKRKK